MLTRREVLIAGSVSTALSAKTAWTKPSSEPLKIGLTPVILTDQFAFLSRWARYLSDQTDHPVSFVVRESYQSILDLLMTGQVNRVASWSTRVRLALFELQTSRLPLTSGAVSCAVSVLSMPRSALRLDHSWSCMAKKMRAFLLQTRVCWQNLTPVQSCVLSQVRATVYDTILAP